MAALLALAAGGLLGLRDEPAYRGNHADEAPRLRIEGGIYIHDFDSGTDLDADYGFRLTLGYRAFERLWVFGEFRHVETVFDVPGPNPSFPKVDVDTLVMGVAGIRPLEGLDGGWFSLYVASGIQKYDDSSIPGEESDEIVWLAGASLIHSGESVTASVGGEIEYIRTAFNQPAGKRESMLNFVAYLSLGVQF